MEDLALALRAVRAGAAVASGHFAALSALRTESKPDGSLVSVADRDTEAAIRAVLAEARPDDAVLGEEGGESGGAAGNRRRWIVDPIDGTALFLRGDGRWLVLLALEVDGEITVGVAAVPAQDRVLFAARGAGAHESRLDGSSAMRVRTSGAGSGRARVATLPDVPWLTPAELHLVAPLLDAGVPTPWPVHPAIMVARGDLDLAVQVRGSVWDFAPFALILPEAGGAYATAAGDPRPGPGPSVYAAGADRLAAALASLG